MTTQKMPAVVSVVCAFAHARFFEILELQMSKEECRILEKLSGSVVGNLGLIVSGQIEDKVDEPLPGLTFLRHCGTPLADRYFKEMGLAMRDTFGAQAYEQLRAALAAQLINL